ncbi:hypothetical protein ZHAS_00004403 [Anopheles sinensis]|uniref:Uncharacterized protein n=1 Tax=Anopheles sinensis TaxID=74873 RepID=A0A084VGU8_ANOSI|nr:hypothetical protein ZHAS_00004403 [Anopheles sinensis]
MWTFPGPFGLLVIFGLLIVREQCVAHPLVICFHEETYDDVSVRKCTAWLRRG